jgi:hypothetical protein
MSVVQPIFSKNRDTLLSQLRLSGANSKDAIAAIDATILFVGTELYSRLGGGLVDTVRGYPYSTDPTSGEEARTRLRASLLEEKWVRYELLRKMPTLFHDSSGDSTRRWNEEELTREGSREDDELNRLMSDITQMLDSLSGGTEEPGISAKTFGPETTPVYRPGGSSGSTLGQWPRYHG